MHGFADTVVQQVTSASVIC